MKKLRNWIVTIPFLFTFGLLLAVFDGAQRIARLFGRRPHEYVVAALQWALVQSFRIAGTRLQLDRSPHVLRHTPYLIVANHQSMFDIPIFGALFFTNFPKYVSKRSLAKWIPSISYNLRRGGNALIDRGDPEQAVGAIQALATEVQTRGVSAVIFPEGTRARHGEMGKFRRRGTLALLDAAPDTAVVPVCIDQSWRLLENNLFPVPFGVTVRVWIGDPIARHAGEDHEALLDQVEASIRSALEDHRAGLPPRPSLPSPNHLVDAHLRGSSMPTDRNRGPFLTVMAVLFAILAVSNATKALQHLQNPAGLGMVIFGIRFESLLANLVLGPLMGAVLAAYAYGLWKLRAWVAPLSIAYAFYVPVNLVLFWYRQTNPEVPSLVFMLGYLAVSLIGSVGTALYLGYHRDKLTS